MIRDWLERRLRNRIIQDRIKAGPPLAGKPELLAGRLAEIGTALLLGEQQRTRRQLGETQRQLGEIKLIGRTVNEMGGMTLMKDVLHRAEALSLLSDGPSILRFIEMRWDGIGDWMG